VIVSYFEQVQQQALVVLEHLKHTIDITLRDRGKASADVAAQRLLPDLPAVPALESLERCWLRVIDDCSVALLAPNEIRRQELVEDRIDVLGRDLPSGTEAVVAPRGEVIAVARVFANQRQDDATERAGAALPDIGPLGARAVSLSLWSPHRYPLPVLKIALSTKDTRTLPI